MRHRPSAWLGALVALTVVSAACGDAEPTGQAFSEAGGASSSTESTSIEDTATSDQPATSDQTATEDSTASSVETSAEITTTASTTTTTATTSTTSTTTTTTTTTTTVPDVAAGLPTPEDVALQYDSLCLQTDSRNLVEKWFEPGVLDDLNCRDASDGLPPLGGNVQFSGCEPIEGAAGEASHGCFFYYEGGGYTLLVGDLGRGYRGLAATFVVD